MLRVREALGDSRLRNALRHKLPKTILSMPNIKLSTATPTALLKEIDCIELGCLTEVLLQSEELLSSTVLIRVTRQMYSNKSISDSTWSSQSTHRYLESVESTRVKVRAILDGQLCSYNSEVSQPQCYIVGHPDILSKSHIFEVKTTRKMKLDWKNFIYQLFCYAALEPTASQVHLVFPLQQYIWSYDLSAADSWPKREAFLALMIQHQTQPVSAESRMFYPVIMSHFLIGFHVKKCKKLTETLQKHVDQYSGRPLQITFTQSLSFTISDSDIAESLSLVESHRLQVFVHAPDCLNLAGPASSESEHYAVKSLREHLTVTRAFGGLGVVVHVGKHCDRFSPHQAEEEMRKNIIASLEFASLDCPLLLETPAGAGTELLTQIDDFMNFVTLINDPRLGVVIDTCHVFASGMQPDVYLSKTLTNPKWSNLVKLIHFNDSCTEFNSHVDLHSQLGRGKIPCQILANCVKLSIRQNIPLVIE